MSNEMTIIPQLRFPEFLEKEGWEIKEVGEIFQVTRGYVLSMTLVKELPTEEYLYPVFSSQTKNNGLAGYYNEYLYEDAITWTTDGANAGDVNYREGKFYCTNVCGVLLNEEGYANPCIAELINSVSKKHVSYVGNPKLMNGVMSKIEIPVPSIPEQQKIASCLSSLDELLAAHSDKLVALKDHKKGLMQNLFPQEGETVPKVRFQEFEDEGKWIKTTVEMLIQEKVLFPPKDGNHGSIHPKSSDYVKTGIPFIMASDLKNGKIDFSKCAYLKKEQADSLQKGFAKSGDVLLTHKGTVGEVALLGELEYPYIMLTPQVTYYRIKDKSKLGNGFLSAFFNSDFFQKNLLKVSGGGTRAYVGITKQKEFDINYPKNPKEQQKIASSLSALDELITAQAEKIKQLQQHKKGLMQGLFPKIES
jgi:type I restriction enzyme, S subunit